MKKDENAVISVWTKKRKSNPKPRIGRQYCTCGKVFSGDFEYWKHIWRLSKWMQQYHKKVKLEGANRKRYDDVED